MAWSRVFTNAESFNNNTNYTTSSVLTPNMFNVPYQNTLWLYDNKVDKITGKGLSTNDFTDGYKNAVDSNTNARHTHTNKELLDTYTQTEANLSDAVLKKHSHSNIDVLNATEKAFTTALKNKVDNSLVKGNLANNDNGYGFGTCQTEDTLPSGLSGAYKWGTYVSFAQNNGRFELYAPHHGNIYARTGWNNDRKNWEKLAFVKDIPTLENYYNKTEVDTKVNAVNTELNKIERFKVDNGNFVSENLWTLGTKNITANTNVYFTELNLTAGTYTLSSTATNGQWVIFIDSTQVGNTSVTNPITFTLTTYSTIRVFFNTANGNVDFMLNEGSSALPYTPYFNADERYVKKTELPTIPTKTSELTNDSGFLTSHQDISAYLKRTAINATSGKYNFHIQMGSGRNLYIEFGRQAISSPAQEITQEVTFAYSFGEKPNIVTGIHSNSATGFWIFNAVTEISLTGFTIKCHGNSSSDQAKYIWYIAYRVI
jgi:hypothetical protein